MDYTESLPVERLKKVIAGDQGGVSESVNWQRGGNFIYCELMSYNQVFMDKVQSAQSSQELLNIWHEMSRESFLNWYVKRDRPVEAEDLFISINDLDKQRKTLVELLDKNQLYVHLSEIEDANFNVSESDRALNKDFYGEDDDA